MKRSLHRLDQIAKGPWLRARHGARRRRDVDLELAHEPEEVGPLEPERPCPPRAIAARLGQGRLDEPPFEIAGGNQRDAQLPVKSRVVPAGL